MATEYDAGSVFFSNQRFGERPESDDSTPDRATATQQYREFIRSYRDDADVFIYREQLLSNYRKKKFVLQVDLQHLQDYSGDRVEGGHLRELLERHPNEYLPVFEDAARLALEEALLQAPPEGLKPIQIELTGDQNETPIREIMASDVNKLLRVPGIVISASKTRAKAISITIRCKTCNTTKELPCNSAFGGVSLPRTCDARLQADAVAGQADCGLDPYIIEADKSTFVDQQTLKLQEAPDRVPTGEMPRHMLLSVSRNLVDRVSPGTHVEVMGVSSIFNPANRRGLGAVAVRTPYLRVVGVQVVGSSGGRMSASFTPEEEEHIRERARDGDVYEQLAQSIAPAIQGSDDDRTADLTEDIKKAILCLLMGGSRKVLPDGMRLRGDINILMLGDPSTAKSQFLKFVEKVAPVGVYTSGKGSSAAGLTASVVRDSKGEFYLEGGAMVLADGGVVCIDEFDKMREEDRVAIHEAMEQQTISVAKAGITTILNSRSAVLAAANPVFGRYDDRRSAAENIDFLPTILSRFDLIFIVRDIQNDDRDKTIAKHVMQVHANATQGGGEEDSESPFKLEEMKKYIAFCRSKCAPRLGEKAAEALQSKYVSIRESQRRRQIDFDEYNTVPITVRQLEAIVRISEARAKCELEPEVLPNHVDEAIRLFDRATMNAAKAGSSVTAEGAIREDLKAEVKTVESALKRRLAIGSSAQTRRLIDEMVMKGFDERAVSTAVHVMLQRGELAYRAQRKTLVRHR